MMMILAPDSIATNQQPTIAGTSPTSFQCQEKAGLSNIPVYSSDDEEDDSRDRQSHWKRIKTRSDDNPRGSSRNIISYTERDRHSYSYEASSHTERRPQPHSILSQGLNPRPEHRMIVLKNRLHDTDVGRLGLRSGSNGLDVPLGRVKDGGTASKEMDAGASKRKFEPNAKRSMISMNFDMYDSSMVVREQHMARRLPVERGTEERYEVRVCGREEGEFYGEDDSLFLEDSRQVEDDYASLRERPRITLDLREALNRRNRGADAISRENRGYGDQTSGQQNGERGSDVKVRVKRVDFDLSFGNGKGSLAAPKASEVRKVFSTGKDEGKDFASLRIGASAAAVGSKSEGDMEAERRQEKRERWAEKERDLEKELEKREKQNMAKSQPKPVTVVDFSDKFTVAKAPLGVPVKPVESDPHRLCQRQKQIDYGKNTLGYERYVEMVPRYQRTKAHPRTPDIRQVCSKRSWDGQIRKWRRLLHEYDPPKEEDDEDPDQMFVPTREHDSIRGSTTDDSLMDMQSELVEDADLKIYDGWSDDEC